jgi:hypothetical protein
MVLCQLDKTGLADYVHYPNVRIVLTYRREKRPPMIPKYRHFDWDLAEKPLLAPSLSAGIIGPGRPIPQRPLFWHTQSAYSKSAW